MGKPAGTHRRRSRWGASAGRLLALLALGCAALPERLQPAPQVVCDGAERQRVDCSASRALQSQVLQVNAGLSQIGLGFDGSYETHALEQVRESTEHLALNLESLCQDYNACVLDRERYVEQTARIRELLSRHLGLALEQQASPDPERGDELWSNARPDLAGARLRLRYRVEARRGKSTRTHRSGEALETGDELRLVFEPSREAYVYVLLLSSQGTSARLFPLPEHGLDNPLPPARSVTVPPPERVRLQLDASTGVEHLHIVASSTPLAGLAAASTPPPPEARAGRAQGPRLLREVGQLLCPDGNRALQAGPSSVACGGQAWRGLQLVAPAAEEGAAGESLLAARPNDDVIVFQHEIVHR